MATLGLILMLVGVLLNLGGGIILLIAAFRVSILWGIGMFIPFVGIVFLFKYWEEAKTGFLISLGGVGLQIIAGLMTGSAGA